MSLKEIGPDHEIYGHVRYFHADRCYNTENLRQFNKGKIKAEEIVTYDCGLMELIELETEDELPRDAQIIAMIVRPGTEPERGLARENFVFCGFDLVELMTAISAITNCGAMFSDAINYNHLNNYGLIPDYRAAEKAQQALLKQYPDESHANCEIIEIWRKLSHQGLKIEIGIIESIDFEYDYSAYQPENYKCISLNDCYLDDWWRDLSIIRSYFHNMKRPSLSIARYGVTILPPDSLGMFQDIMLKDKRLKKDRELQRAAGIIGEAIACKKYIIIYGV